MHYAFSPRLMINLQILALFSLLGQFRVYFFHLFPPTPLDIEGDKDIIIFVVSYDKNT